MPNATHSIMDLAISEKRLEPYEKEARKHPGVEAADLYRWNTLFSGVAVTQISFVEMSVRNAMDKELMLWARANGFKDWLGETPPPKWFRGSKPAPLKRVPPLIRKLMGAYQIQKMWSSCRQAYKIWKRNPNHEKHGQYPNRHDAFAQLTFGGWQRLLGPTDFKSKDPTVLKKAAAARQLWKEALYKAFPGMTDNKVNDRQRVKLLLDIDRIRRLRNRVSHGENVLTIQTDQYLDKMLAVLSDINPHISDWVMGQTGRTYRTVAKLKYYPELLQSYQQNDPLPSSKEIVAYKLTSSGSYSGEEVIEAQLKNSQSHGGRTFMTVGKPPLEKNKLQLREILLVDAGGKKAAVGEIVAYGYGNGVQPPKGYDPPAYEKQYKKRKAWFAIKNLYEVDCQGGRVIGYQTTDGQKVPGCFTGQVTMRYVCHD
ncbi:hypothetical protein [Bifidobacterium sp. ESL0825]|uniref:hypothetical protein n=1 Tax=Bifidobacterium sp. ESL0825 TaxID=3448587 RepID=UPI00404110F8